MDANNLYKEYGVSKTVFNRLFLFISICSILGMDMNQLSKAANIDKSILENIQNKKEIASDEILVKLYVLLDKGLEKKIISKTQVLVVLNLQNLILRELGIDESEVF